MRYASYIYTHNRIVINVGRNAPAKIKNRPIKRSVSVFSTTPEIGIALPVALLPVWSDTTKARVAVLVTLVIGSRAATTIVCGPASRGSETTYSQSPLASVTTVTV